MSDDLLAKATISALRAKHELIDRAIKEALILGLSHVYVWDEWTGTGGVSHAAFTKPEGKTCVRYDLGHKIIVGPCDCDTETK